MVVILYWHKVSPAREEAGEVEAVMVAVAEDVEVALVEADEVAMVEVDEEVGTEAEEEDMAAARAVTVVEEEDTEAVDTEAVDTKTVKTQRYVHIYTNTDVDNEI